MNWKQKLLRALALVLALSFCLAGCEGAPQEESSLPEAAMKNDGHSAEITLGEVFRSRERTAALEEIAAKYQADYPETEITIRTFDTQEALEAALRAGELDIAELSQEEQPGYVQDGLLLDLTPWLDAWQEKNTLTWAAVYITSSLGEEHAYLMPSGYEQQIFYYRKDWADSYNQDKSGESNKVWYNTWEQLTRVSGFLGDKGKLAFAGKDKLTDTFNAIFWSACGHSRIAELGSAYQFSGEQGGTLFAQERGEEAVDQFVRVMEQAVLPGAVDWTEEQAIQAFQNEEAGMLLAGRDAADILKETMPENTWVSARFPRGLSKTAVMPLDSFTGWGISAETGEEEIAAHFLTFLSNADNNTHYALICGEPPIHMEAGQLELSLNDGVFAAEMEMVGEGNVFLYAGLPMTHAAYEGSREALDLSLRRLLAGELTQQEFLQELDNRWS